MRKSPTVGTVPKSTCSTSRAGSSTSTTPTTTRPTWVRKSATAKPMFTPADSFAPTTFTTASSTTIAMPPKMSAGDSPSGSQNTPR